MLIRSKPVAATRVGLRLPVKLEVYRTGAAVSHQISAHPRPIPKARHGRRLNQAATQA
jgi:hypothetical protein